MDLNKNELISKIEQLEKENAELKNKSGHMSGLEIAADLALMLCVALLMTIIHCMKGAHDMGFFELIKNAFGYIF